MWRLNTTKLAPIGMVVWVKGEPDSLSEYSGQKVRVVGYYGDGGFSRDPATTNISGYWVMPLRPHEWDLTRLHTIPEGVFLYVRDAYIPGVPMRVYASGAHE